MEITLMQAIVIFWISLAIWVMVEYLFYKMQHSNRRQTINNSFSGAAEKPIYKA